MDGLGSLLSLIPLVVLVGLVAAVVYGIRSVTRRRRDFAEIDPGIGTVRRLYFYVVSFVALMMAANGVVLIATAAMETLFGGEILSPSNEGVAWGLALTIVGLPLWASHWRIVGKHVKDLPVETRSVVRKAYIYVVLAVATGIAVATSVTVVRWTFGGQSFNGYPWAAFVVWCGVWAFHWRLESKEGQTTPETRAVRRLYLYLVAAVMLVVAASGIGVLIGTVLGEAYDSLTSVPVLDRSGLWGASTKTSLALALVAAPVWAAHWLYFARHDYASLLRQIYLYPFAMLGSIVTVLTALGIVIYGALEWTLGVPDDGSAAAHFDFLPAALASLIVGGGVLAYHWLAAESEAETPTPEPQRARRFYPYALAALGLGALAVGIATLVGAAMGMIVDSGRQVVSEGEVGRRAIALSVTLLLLGTPLWGYYWARIQRRVKAGDTRQRSGLPRRIVIFGVLGAGMLALLGSVSYLVFVFFRDLLDGDLSQFLRESKESIAVIAPAAIFLPYYWMVYREDRREAATGAEEEARKQKTVTVLVTESGTAFLRELEAALGYGVSPLRWADADASQPELSAAELRELAQQISDAPGDNVLVVPDEMGVRVLSYS